MHIGSCDDRGPHPTEHRWHARGAESWATPLTQLRIPIVPADPYHEQMRNFAAVIRGEEAPILSGRDGAITLATTLAITEAARRGGPVNLDQFMAA